MTDTLDKPQAPKVTGKTVQEYIDELPQWPDGTALKSMPMTAMQFRIWALACAGKFFEGMVVFMTGVALPLISIQFHLNAAEKGMVTAAPWRASWSVRRPSVVWRTATGASGCSSSR